MDDFESIMKQVEEQSVNEFRNQARALDGQGPVDRRRFVSFFLGHFLGYDLSHANSSVLHEAVDSVSLCEPEIVFFHRCVDADAQNANEFLDIFRNIVDLENCQLGPSIKRCLEGVKDLKLVEATESVE
eukprot:TRINITY_DN32607_c0_g1_i1.p1 TRINITY_DN32607_c0_g1~~TRINITY_DN32607_c0_g1_i1.p1  ORF type:complete len:129 (-),score=17.09 TRINITY_DN32607_c0_g1_i1:143-529(-)